MDNKQYLASFTSLFETLRKWKDGMEMESDKFNIHWPAYQCERDLVDKMKELGI